MIRTVISWRSRVRPDGFGDRDRWRVEEGREGEFVPDRCFAIEVRIASYVGMIPLVSYSWPRGL
jgi:hypothetical protein